LKKKIEELEKGAVKAWNTVNPPRLIHRVDPVYPPEAMKAQRAGSVVLSVRTDGEGKVQQVLVLRSSDAVFNQSAIDAVKQWKYEPYIQDGRPTDLVFTVNVRFNPK
jgi:protein TonB